VVQRAQWGWPPVGAWLLAAVLAPVCLAQVLPGQAGGEAVQAPKSALVAGRVVDHAGIGVANAVVWLRTPPPPNAPPPRGPQGDRVATNADGRFAFSGLAAGAYQIDAIKPGWLTGAYGRRRPGGNSSSLEIADGERRNDLTITVWRTAVIGGRVVDDRGDPLIGAEIRAIRQTYISGRPQGDTPIRARTDDRGVYRFADLLPGDYIVALLMNVTSEPPTLAGAIRAGGRPRAYLQTMSSLGAMPMVFDEATTVTGPEQPLIRSLTDSVTATAAGQPMLTYATTYFPSASSIRTAKVVTAPSGEAQEGIDFTVRLQPTWQVSGMVRDAEGPAAWHAVHLIPADAGDTPVVDVSTAITDGKGAFTLFGVPRGQYIARVVRIPWPAVGTLGVIGGTGAIRSIGTTLPLASTAGPAMPSADPLMHSSETVTVTDRHVRDLQLVLQPGARVKGFVQFEGTGGPPDLTRVRLRIEQVGGRLDSAVVSAVFTSEHKFSSQGLLPGRYLIRADTPPGWTFKGATYQGRDVSESPVELTGEIDGVVITYTNRSSAITGSVAAAAPADPAGAQVMLFPVDPVAWMDYGRTSRRITSRVVDAKGDFSLTLPPPGEYWLVALADEDAQDWQNPARLKQLATVAERIRVGADSISGQSLQLRRLR
jgi:protocatechuate 3,4-dioxygenase beta subunit